jgi:acyl-CoA synthetase (AMP-forming)/AMP-acid ligase II
MTSEALGAAELCNVYGATETPDATKGEIVAAAAEPRPGVAADAAAIMAFCRERLASYEVPARLPRTPPTRSTSQDW